MGNNIIKVPYDGFRRLIDEYKKRLYYYVFSDNSLELNFLSDSFVVSTMLKSNEIKNAEIFFQQQMFYNSEKLTSPMTIVKSIFDTIGEGTRDIVKDNQSESQKQSDPDFNKEEGDTDNSVE